MTEAVTPEQLRSKAQEIVEHATTTLGLAAGAIKLNKVHVHISYCDYSGCASARIKIAGACIVAADMNNTKWSHT